MAKEERSDFWLVLDNGDLVDVEYPTDVFDDLFQEILDAKDWWWTGNYDISVTYKGQPINRMNMRRVVGIQ